MTRRSALLLFVLVACTEPVPTAPPPPPPVATSGLPYDSMEPLAFSTYDDGLTPWHVDVQWIPSRRQFWAVYNAKQPGSCTTPALFLATSADGLSWTPNREPLVRNGVTPAFKDIVYRTTFRYDASTDDLWLWISRATYTNGRWIWSTALQRRRATQSLEATASRAALDFEPPPAHLTEWP